MEKNLQKQFSAVLRLNQFETLNGELNKFQDKNEQQKYIKQFLLQKYGKKEGKFEVILKTNKVKLVWTPSKVDFRAEALHRDALALAKNKNYKDAINNWVKAISINTSDPDYYFNLGIAFFESKNFTESIENLEKVIDLCPIYPNAYLILGTTYIKTRKFDQAEIQLKESIVINPKHALAYLNLGAVYSIIRKYAEGIEMFQRSLELSPKEVRAHFGLGKIHALQGKADLANEHFKKVIEIDTNRALTNHAKKSMILPPVEEKNQGYLTSRPKGLVYSEMSYQEGYKAYLFTDYDKSVNMYTRYLEQKPDDDFVWFSLGEAHLRSGRPSKAVEAFQKAISVNSSKALYYKELALSLGYLNRDADALECIQKAQKLGKNDSVLFALQGNFLIKKNQIQDAIEILGKALKLNSNNLLAKYYLALAYKKNNEISFAVNYLQEIIRSPINSPIKMEAEAMMREVQAN